MKTCPSVARPLARRTGPWAAGLLATLLLVGCGQKGPLTLPAQADALAKPPSPTAPAASAAPTR